MWSNERWLLPDGIEEMLPAEAWRMEALRRKLIDLLYGWGYDLVTPPLLEYLEALLTGTGEDLDLETFKVTDQHTGRLMGIRADMTPQVARIEAHFLKSAAPVRLCYAGPSLFARAQPRGGSREPFQFGAELFGLSAPEADGEILRLMVQSLREAGIPDTHIDIGHVGIFRALARDTGLDRRQEAELYDAFQRKSKPDISALLTGYGLSSAKCALFTGLAELNGGVEVLDAAEQRFAGVAEEVSAALTNLRAVVELAASWLPDTPVYLDLAELRGYRYHTGVVFAAFVPAAGRALARGGRYDDIGQAFGHPRPATGFSADLRRLLRLAAASPEPPPRAIAAPFSADPALGKQIDALRSTGERVVSVADAQPPADVRALCDRRLVRRNGRWTVEPLAREGGSK